MKRIDAYFVTIVLTLTAAYVHAGNRYPTECKDFEPKLVPAYAPEPRYPQKAMSRSMQGCVFVSLNIDSDGQPYNIELVSEHPPKYGFARSALKAAEKLRYEVPTETKETQASESVVFQFQYRVWGGR